MKLELVRRWFSDACTIGQLSVDGQFECFILEDRFRLPWEPKIYGRTCIPCGTFPVVISHSPRFGVEMPLLLDVPGFHGVRIHPGNSPHDTEGCLLPGSVRDVERVLESREAYAELFKKLKTVSPELIQITITAVFS